MSLFEIYLPLAGIKLSIPMLLLVGLVTGIISGLFGLGGGLISLPYLLLSGVPVSVAIATTTNQMTAGTFSSFLNYARHKLVDYKLALTMLIGSIIGSITGVGIFNKLSEHHLADTAVPIILLVVLMVTTYTTAKDALRILLKKPDPHKHAPVRMLRALPLKTTFRSCEHQHSMIIPMAIGMLGGIATSIVGIGGGFIMIPAMLYLLRCGERYISGTTAFQIVFTSIFSTILHSVSDRHIDIILALILVVGTVFGSQIGSAIGRKIHPERYRLLLALVIVLISIEFAYGMFIAPENAWQINRVIK